MYGSVGKEESDSLLHLSGRVPVNEQKNGWHLVRSPRFLLGILAMVAVAIFGVTYQGSNASNIGILSGSFKSDKVIDDDRLLENILDKLESEGDGTSSCTCSATDNSEVSHGGETDYVTATCISTDVAAMGGADLVEYFNQNEQGNDYSSFAGQLGDTTITTVYAGYTFNFINSDNLAKFIANPTFYLPQNGGFCSLAISAEFCPTFSWDAACLGPNGELSSWEIVNNKLYFFLDETAKNIFGVDSSKLIESSATRWSEWFSNDEKDGMFTINTACVQTGTAVDATGTAISTTTTASDSIEKVPGGKTTSTSTTSTSTTRSTTSTESDKVPGGKTSSTTATTSTSTDKAEGGKTATTPAASGTSTAKTESEKVPGGKLA